MALVFEDAQNDAGIAESLGISRRQLARWKAHPTFVAAWERLAERYRASLLGR